MDMLKKLKETSAREKEGDDKKKGPEEEPSASEMEDDDEKEGPEEEPSASEMEDDDEKEGPEEEPSASETVGDDERKGPEEEPSAREKEGDDKKKGPEEVKIITVGPWGGDREQKFDNERKEFDVVEVKKFDDGTFSGIREMRIGYEDFIRCIEVVYEDRDGNPTEKFLHDQDQYWSKFAEIKLGPQEFFSKVNGTYGTHAPTMPEPIFYFEEHQSTAVVTSLTFVSNVRTYGPYGVERGKSFSFTTDGNKIVGLMGRSSWWAVHAIGFHMSAPLPRNPLRRGWVEVRSICQDFFNRRKDVVIAAKKIKKKENLSEAMNSVAKVIGQQLSYIFHENKSKVKELENCTMNIRAARDRVQQQFGRKINDHVKPWLEEVDAIIVEIERTMQDENMASCSNGLSPKLGSKRHLNRRVINIKHNVDQLLQQAQRLEESKKGFVSGNEIVDTIMNVKRDSYLRMNGTYRLSDKENHSLVKQILSRKKYDIIQKYDQSLGSRNRTLEKIMEALKAPTFAIGIYGQDGIGKTTLAKEVARRAKEEKLFDKVGVINVSRNLDTKEIQSKIADVMELKLEVENVLGRAQILAESLYVQKNLIILDDMWEAYQLQRNWEFPTSDVIPSKILLTSRSSMLLSEYVKEEYMFPMGVLEEVEAKTLLRKTVGVVEELQDSAFESLVDKFAIKTCALSPHLILSIGSYLGGKSHCQWKIALKMLQDIKFTEFALQDMSYPIELSFRLIGDNSPVTSFGILLLAQMGHHLSVMDLTLYFYCLVGPNVQNNFDLSYKYIFKVFRHLKESNLVLDSYSRDCITMHDEFRDFALSISSNQHNFFTMWNGILEKWPKNEELKSCTAIILHSSVIINELPEGIHCPKLKVFHLESNDPFLKIPDKFFEGMNKLQALELIGIQPPILSSSISSLKDLKMLSLERCNICDNLSKIGELKSLVILSLSRSSIESLPNELGKLCCLAIFNISNCPKLKVIPREVLSRLTQLEHFYTRNTLIQWWVEGQENQSENASLVELTQLPGLRALEIDCPDVAAATTNALFDKLETYKIVIGDSNELPFNATKIPNENEVSKSLAILRLKEGTNSQKKITSLFNNVENLLLGDKVYGIQNVYKDMNLKEFSYLKHLSVVNSLGIQHIINSEDLLEEAFSNLESLYLMKLPNMKTIIALERYEKSTKWIGSDQLSPGFHFQNLMKLNVKACGSLRCLLSFSMAACLANLACLSIAGCEMMEEIIAQEINTNETEGIIFPKLKEFQLFCMKRLRTIWHSHGDPNSYSMLDSVDIEECKNLITIFPNHMVGRTPNLAKLKVVNCPLMEEIFDTAHLNEAKVSIFPKLEELHLNHMERLTTLWHIQDGLDSCNALDSVIIEECPKLVTIFPNYMLGKIPLLITLKVVNCQSVEEIFDINEKQPNVIGKETCLRFVHIEALPNLKHIWNKDPEGILSFNYLKKVWVSNCPNLKNLIPIPMASDLEYIESLTIRDCNMEEIV